MTLSGRCRSPCCGPLKRAPCWWAPPAANLTSTHPGTSLCQRSPSPLLNHPLHPNRVLHRAGSCFWLTSTGTRWVCAKAEFNWNNHPNLSIAPTLFLCGIKCFECLKLHYTILQYMQFHIDNGQYKFKDCGVKVMQITASTDRSMKQAPPQTARTLCVAAKTPDLPAGGGGRPGTGEPTVSVTCLYERWRTSWKTWPQLDPGIGSTGPETYQRTMFGLRPGNSSCQSLQSSPGSSTSNFLLTFSSFI